MTPTDHNQDSSPTPFAVDQHDQLYITAKTSQACLSSSHSDHFFTYPIQDQGGFCHREMPQLSYQEAATLDSRGSSHHQTQESESDHWGGLKLSLWKEENGSHENQSDYHSGSTESTKKRLILKMMKPNPYQPERDQTPSNAQLMIKSEDQKFLQAPNSSSSESTKHGSNNVSSGNMSNNPFKVCSDCNTTKTPLWRSGPRGPKSLCNACGIRQRKARRAMAAAAAAAAANDTILEAETSPTKTDHVQLKDKRPTNGGYSRKHKKRSKISTTTTSQGKRKKTCFEEFLISLRNNLAFQRVFPQDEKEAAILLMALSYGLFHG